MLVPVILSGGTGTRLLPVSRSAYPNPVMHMAGGDALLKKPRHPPFGPPPGCPRVPHGSTASLARAACHACLPDPTPRYTPGSGISRSRKNAEDIASS